MDERVEAKEGKKSFHCKGRKNLRFDMLTCGVGDMSCQGEYIHVEGVVAELRGIQTSKEKQAQYQETW